MENALLIPDEVWEYLVGLGKWTKEELKTGLGGEPVAFYRESLKPHLMMLCRKNPDLPMVSFDRDGCAIALRLE